MIPIHETAKLSAHVYNIKRNLFDKSIQQSTLTQRMKMTRPTEGWYFIPDASPTLTPAANFFAALYIKFEQGDAQHAVIAFRGTMVSHIDNIIEDIVSWYSSAMGTDWHDQVPSYYQQAIIFTSRALMYLRKNFPDLSSPGRLRFTGHSLGGALAQLITLTDFPAKSIIFNSPVCRNMVNKSTLENSDLIHNVNAHYGVINKIGGIPLGKIYVVGIPQRETEAKFMFDHFNQNEFNTAKILSQLGDSSHLLTPIKLMGASAHLAAMATALQGLKDLPNEHAEILACENQTENLKPIQRLTKSLREHYCDLNITLNTVPEVIMAQHDIGNMIHALSNQAMAVGGTVL